MVLLLVTPEGVTALLGAKEAIPQTCVVMTPAATNCLAPQSQGMALAPAVPTMVGLALPTTPDPQLEEATSLIQAVEATGCEAPSPSPQVRKHRWQLQR